MSQRSVVDIVRVSILVHEARKRRKPPGSKAVFFGEYDLWMYNAVLDDRLCNDCLEHEKVPRYFGSQLITKFPYLEVVDDNTIKANVHPNCRCTLNRIVNWTLDDIKWFIMMKED